MITLTSSRIEELKKELKNRAVEETSTHRELRIELGESLLLVACHSYGSYYFVLWKGMKALRYMRSPLLGDLVDFQELPDKDISDSYSTLEEGLQRLDVDPSLAALLVDLEEEMKPLLSEHYGDHYAGKWR
jgi:hypothetical protein